MLKIKLIGRLIPIILQIILIPKIPIPIILLNNIFNNNSEAKA